MSPLPGSPTVAPTAPGRLPLIGHAHQLARRPLDFMDSLRGQGSVVRILLGPTPAYVVTDPAVTRKVLVTEVDAFAKGGKIIDALRVFFGDGLATIADGDLHMKHRRLMQPMFNKAHIATRGDVMIDHVRTATYAWTPGVARETYEDMNDLTLSTFLVALFGSGLPAHVEEEFTGLMPAIMRGTIRQTILPGWVTKLPLPANRAHERRVARLRALIDQAIDHHRAQLAAAPTASEAPAGCPAHQSAEQAPGGGLFSTLLTADDPETGPLSRQQLQDEAITLLTGAIETTGTTLAWALYEISRNPKTEQRLHEELDAACGDRPLTQQDLAALPYMRAVLKETMRMYGPAWLVTRTTTRPVTLDGHPIPKGADVIYSPYVHQHDPEVYADPGTFAPDRWEPERAKGVNRSSFLAFGDGRRKCIGEEFAWTELLIILATVLQRWRLTLTSAPPRPQAIVTVKPDKLSMTPHPRTA
ncbi:MULTISPECIES: cytochrome P450 [Streptomyces]|uniref:Cytochrome P450 n=1 Tax=Streptomyces dengpaensis TaxID=2049881 RepID=A0ABM6SKI1_9ACTN|nr:MULTISPECIES: cytochrome P450 [Streptomyces]AVH54998.1 cytochrome P450 [Streptomyces dengpaensis]PIB08293.1 cytochrome P450 [Streptomyces sp. HG99]